VVRAMTLAFVLAFPVFAAVQLELEVEPQSPITRRMLFVVDRSGSMHGDHFARALAAVREMFEHPTDDLEVGVIAFNDGTTRWPGRPEPDRRPRPVPPGWASLPAEDVVADANRWLEELGAGGDTLIMPALRAALTEPRNELSVILVTDGLFGRERTDDIMGLIATLQEERERQGLDRAVIACYGLGPSQKVLARIAEVGLGGYVREEVPLDEDVPMLQPATTIR
jgi:Mg-chelatase subunit ChlD